MFCFPDLKNPFCCSLKLSIANNNLVNYTFANKYETITLSLTDPFRIQKLIVSMHSDFYDNIVILHKFRKNLFL